MARSPAAQAAIDSRDKERAMVDDGMPGKPVPSGQAPTHYLSAFTRNSPEAPKGRVGSAWQKPDGSISIKLNPYVHLTSEIGLTLWPKNERDNYGS